MAFAIKGRVALVTGGTAGIGLACARELLRNGARAVTIAGSNKARGEEALKKLADEFGPNRVIFAQTDVTDADQQEDAFKRTLDTWNGLDIVVNNAGILNDANWEREIATNVGHVVRGSLLAIKYIGKNNGGAGGVVVNVASILGLQPLAGSPIYVGTKHFIVGLDRSLGTPFYYEQTGIRFLTLCPGVTDTSMITEAGKFALQAVGPSVAQELVDALGALPPQPTEVVAEGLITIVTKGENGSVWVSEGGEPIYEVIIPPRQTLRKI